MKVDSAPPAGPFGPAPVEALSVGASVLSVSSVVQLESGFSVKRFTALIVRAVTRLPATIAST